MVITAVAGAVAAWQWTKAEQKETAAGQIPPPPPTANQPPTSPFGTNHLPIPPPLGELASSSTTESRPNDDCPAICLSEHFEAMVDDLYHKFATNLNYLQTLVVETWWMHVDEAHHAALTPSMDAAVAKSIVIEKLKDIAVKLGGLVESVTRDDVAEFYSYYGLRQLYGEHGAEMLLISLSMMDDFAIQRCVNERKDSLGLTCPKSRDEIDITTAAQYLLNHADNTYSSICSSGSPFPWWSEPDGSGYLFQANSKTGEMYPVSGSGVNMSAPMNSLTDYFTYHQQNAVGFVDPTSREWHAMVESNPVYAWFMASLTPADEGTICNNGDLPGTNTGNKMFDLYAFHQTKYYTYRWCTESDIPNANNSGIGSYSKRHFARMWYDLLTEEFTKVGTSVDGIEQVKDCCYSTLTKYRIQSN